MSAEVGVNVIGLLVNVWLVIKLLILSLMVLYFIFSLIVLRQINLMTETLITEISPVIKGLGFVHVFLALALLVVTLIY